MVYEKMVNTQKLLFWSYEVDTEQISPGNTKP